MKFYILELETRDLALLKGIVCKGKQDTFIAYHYIIPLYIYFKKRSIPVLFHLVFCFPKMKLTFLLNQFRFLLLLYRWIELILIWFLWVLTQWYFFIIKDEKAYLAHLNGEWNISESLSIAFVKVKRQIYALCYFSWVAVIRVSCNPTSNYSVNSPLLTTPFKVVPLLYRQQLFHFNPVQNLTSGSLLAFLLYLFGLWALWEHGTIYFNA